jgi:hypothetical protein
MYLITFWLAFETVLYLLLLIQFFILNLIPVKLLAL